jgi:hypothetical protein
MSEHQEPLGYAALGEAIVDQQHLLANPAERPELPIAAGRLTPEMLDAAIARISEPPVLRVDPVQVRAELALARWLDEQPPGTAEKLLQEMYGDRHTR